jgi:hypothetical protein
MKSKDIFIFKDKRFTVGIEEDSGRYFISILVANQFVDYEEYYEISKDIYLNCPNNVDALENIANRCRKRLNDDHIMILPGTSRGVAN